MEIYTYIYIYTHEKPKPLTPKPPHPHPTHTPTPHFWEFFGAPFGGNTFPRNAPNKKSAIFVRTSATPNPKA